MESEREREQISVPGQITPMPKTSTYYNKYTEQLLLDFTTKSMNWSISV